MLVLFKVNHVNNKSAKSLFYFYIKFKGSFINAVSGYNFVKFNE